MSEAFERTYTNNSRHICSRYCPVSTPVTLLLWGQSVLQHNHPLITWSIRIVWHWRRIRLMRESCTVNQRSLPDVMLVNTWLYIFCDKNKWLPVPVLNLFIPIIHVQQKISVNTTTFYHKCKKNYISILFLGEINGLCFQRISRLSQWKHFKHQIAKYSTY